MTEIEFNILLAQADGPALQFMKTLLAENKLDPIPYEAIAAEAYEKAFQLVSLPSNLCYVLKGKEVVPCTDLLEWGQQQETKSIRETMIGTTRISTVFLGINAATNRELPPVVFETMIFGGPLDYQVSRCRTYDEAEKMHQAAVEQVRAVMPPASVASTGKESPG